MYSRELAIEKAKKFVTQIIANGILIEKAILFGSYSKNAMKEDSDIDVALVFPFLVALDMKIKSFFSKINIQTPFIDIETKTYSSQYFEQGDPFIEEILRTGTNLIDNES